MIQKNKMAEKSEALVDSLFYYCIIIKFPEKNLIICLFIAPFLSYNFQVDSDLHDKT